MGIEAAEDLASEYERVQLLKPRDLITELADYINIGRRDLAAATLDLLEPRQAVVIHEYLVVSLNPAVANLAILSREKIVNRWSEAEKLSDAF